YRLNSPIRSLSLTEAKLSNRNGPNPGRNQGQIAHLLATKPHHKHQEMGINNPVAASVHQTMEPPMQYL
ncbi:TPA: hypothetical protein ACSP74_003763, partial [Aeromonas veronii]